MSATLTTRRIWDAFLGRFEDHKTFYHGHTYGGNPLAAAAGNAVLDLLEGRLGDGHYSLKAIEANSLRFSQVLEPLRELPEVGDLRQLGMMAAIEWVADKPSKTRMERSARFGKRVCDKALERGLWLRPLGDVVPILPAVALSPEDLAWIGKTLEEICKCQRV
jgi:adenosylmethionine-8-amino-7-oxononanoate aminotransferase